MSNAAVARIVSGGQTGADRAGLEVARRLGLGVGGWCPLGGWAEDEPRPPGLLTRHPELRETPTADPAQRTEWNVRDSDATLVLTRGAARSAGTELTVRLAHEAGRPLAVVDVDDRRAVASVESFLAGLPAGATLNVAGPRESECPGLHAAAAAVLESALAGRSADPALVDALRAPGLAADRVAMAELARADVVDLARAASVVIESPVPSTQGATSFVLHAPLELLARCGLAARLDGVDQVANARVVSLAARYAQAVAEATEGRAAEVPSVEPGGEELRRAVESGDLRGADRAVRHLGSGLLAQLATVSVERTAAAGHADIYVHLARSAPEWGLVPMGRGFARELARDPDARMAVMAGEPAPSLSDAFAELDRVGPAGAFGIAPLVAHVTDAGPDGLGRLVATALHEPDAPRDLLRLAAASMVHGDEAAVPYGWTHALTLAQGALGAADLIDEPSRALRAAAVYVGSFWAADGETGSPDLGRVPAPSRDWPELVLAAARGHDAHLVKYTLSCAQCAATDPEADPLFRAATERLHDWWDAHPPIDDPLVAVG